MINYSKQNKLYFLLLAFSFLLLQACAGGKYASYPKDDLIKVQLPKVVKEKVLYACQINGKYGIKKYHFSGLLFVKTMEDNSTRVVFQNEMGFNFFDFEWDAHGKFSVISIQEKMNHTALIKTLQKDFEILLHEPQLELMQKKSTYRLWGKLEKGYVVYEGAKDEQLQDIYVLSDQFKKVVYFKMDQPYVNNALPQIMTIKHYKANFDILLQQLSIED